MTFQYRRNRDDMITTYKICHGFNDSDPFKFLKVNENKTRGHRYRIMLNKCRLDVKKNFHSQRMVKEWNCLPVNIVKERTS